MIALMEAINAVRPQLWRGRALEMLGPETFLDVDGTLAPTGGSKKAGMALSYVWGYATSDRVDRQHQGGPVRGESPGKRAQPHGRGHWIDRSIEHVLPYSNRVCIRGDTDFSLTANFDRWAEKVDFIFGIDAMPNLCTVAENLAAVAWRPWRGSLDGGAPRHAARSRHRGPGLGLRLVPGSHLARGGVGGGTGGVGRDLSRRSDPTLRARPSRFEASFFTERTAWEWSAAPGEDGEHGGREPRIVTRGVPEQPRSPRGGSLDPAQASRRREVITRQASRAR